MLLREWGDQQGRNHPFLQSINPLKGKTFVNWDFKLIITVVFRSISANPGALLRQDEDDGKDGILRHLRGQFQSYSKLGDRRSDGSHITMGQSDKWLKQVQKYSCLKKRTDFFKTFRLESLMEEF